MLPAESRTFALLRKDHPEPGDALTPRGPTKDGTRQHGISSMEQFAQLIMTSPALQKKKKRKAPAKKTTTARKRPAKTPASAQRKR